MEPLVVFGGGLVVYCGYLALMDEIDDIRRWYAKRTASSRSRSSASRAVEMTVDAHGYYFLPKAGDSIPTAVVKVDITGKAGHRIPDG